MSRAESGVITILNAATVTYGVGADFPATNLPGFNHHRVNVLTGSVDVSSLDVGQLPSDTPSIIEAGKTPATRNIYDLTGISQFSMTANSDSTVIITSWS